jgi:hypothetical protein
MSALDSDFDRSHIAPVKTREVLLDLLSRASELEHSLARVYLYAAHYSRRALERYPKTNSSSDGPKPKTTRSSSISTARFKRLSTVLQRSPQSR